MNAQPSSYACEVCVEGKWATNALRFATAEEARMHGRELLSRWFVPTDYRATPSEDPVNARMSGEYQRAESVSQDRYGRIWPRGIETCEECGQPDNCGDCNHEKLGADEARALGACAS